MGASGGIEVSLLAAGQYYPTPGTYDNNRIGDVETVYLMGNRITLMVVSSRSHSSSSNHFQNFWSEHPDSIKTARPTINHFFMTILRRGLPTSGSKKNMPKFKVDRKHKEQRDDHI